jgi:hypothetical protein
LLEYGLLHRGGGGGEPYAAEADALCKDEDGQDGCLLERRRWAEQALISVVATAYLLGVSTRPVEKLAESLGVTQLSKSQVSAMAKHLDEQVAAFRDVLSIVRAELRSEHLAGSLTRV